MARTTLKKPEDLPPPKLIIKKEEADSQITDRITKGYALLKKNFTTEEHFRNILDDTKKWNEYNYELLLRIFDNKTIAEELGKYFHHSLSLYQSIPEEIESYEKALKRKISKLESIKDRLGLIPETTAITKSQDIPQSESKKKSKDIFIVHGSNEGAKSEVARFISKLGLNPIILHEQPNKGKTLIEKFEIHSNVSYAIVILTSDDKGYPLKDEKNVKSRARQNVIFELGFFLGKLGRENVCALYESGVELPSDFEGIVYVPLSNWHFELAKEIKSSGLEIDLNKAIS